MGTAIFVLLPTAPTIGAVLPFIPNRGRGRSGRNVSTRVTLIDLGAGIISSFILTLIDTPFPKAVNRRSVALWALLLAVDLVIGVMVLHGFMSRKEHPSANLGSALRPIIDAYLTFVVFRSVPRTTAQAIMIFPAGSGLFSTQMILTSVGYVLGWMVVALLGAPAFKLLSLSRRRWVMSWILVMLALAYLMLIVYILQTQRAISMSSEAFEVLSWLTNHKAIFSITAMSISLVLTFLVWDERRLMPPKGVDPAQECLKRVRIRLWKLIAGAVADGYLAGALLVTLRVLIDSAKVELSEPGSYSVHSESAVVNVADISDGHLHRFAYTASSGMEVRFIVTQEAGSSLGVGLDIYEICGASGYYEKGGKIICELCEVVMSIAAIGSRGGCNPIPIEYKVPNGTLSAPLSMLEANADTFARTEKIAL